MGKRMRLVFLSVILLAIMTVLGKAVEIAR